MGKDRRIREQVTTEGLMQTRMGLLTLASISRHTPLAFSSLDFALSSGGLHRRHSLTRSVYDPPGDDEDGAGNVYEDSDFGVRVAVSGPEAGLVQAEELDPSESPPPDADEALPHKSRRAAFLDCPWEMDRSAPTPIAPNGLIQMPKKTQDKTLFALQKRSARDDHRPSSSHEAKLKRAYSLAWLICLFLSPLRSKDLSAELLELASKPNSYERVSYTRAKQAGAVARIGFTHCLLTCVRAASLCAARQSASDSRHVRAVRCGHQLL